MIFKSFPCDYLMKLFKDLKGSELGKFYYTQIMEN